jgi:transcription initiation factor IIF auxiliary subunit
MIRLGGLISQKAFGKFEMGKVISNPFATAFIKEGEGEDHEVSMANNSIDTIIKMATELKAKMGEDEKQIPAWIQDHIAKAENLISQASTNYHEYGTNESVNEGAGREAMGIAGFTGTRAIAVQKFIDDFNLNAKKLFNFIAKGKLKDRMDFAAAISGTRGNKYQGNFVGMFGESVINEDNTAFETLMLIRNLEQTNKLLAQDLKTSKRLPNDKKENIKKSIVINQGLINYYKENLKNLKNNESLVKEDGPCWQGYKQVGMKNKGGRQVPNCVPNK